MRNKKIYLFIIFAFMFIIMPSKTYADDNPLILECSVDGKTLNEKSTVKKDDKLTCELDINYQVEGGITIEASGHSYKLTNFKVLNEKIDDYDSLLSMDSNELNLGYKQVLSGDKVLLGKFMVQVNKDSGDATIYIKVSINKEAYDITNTYKISDTPQEPEKDTDATLKSLSLSGITLSPSFNSNTTQYTATTTNSSTEVTATSTSGKATIVGTGKKSLSVGKNTISVVVTAEDGTTKKTYTINITRNSQSSGSGSSSGSSSSSNPGSSNPSTNKSNNSSLSSLKISGTNVKLKPGVYEYSVTVPNTITTANVEYVTGDKNATVSIDGDTDLSEGNYNQITVTVTAQDGSITVYKINVRRNMTSPQLGVGIPASIIFLGIVGALIYFKVKNKSYIQKI